MRAAAALTGVNFRTIRRAKNAGCPAIGQSGRVDCDELIRWLARHPEIVSVEGDVSYEVELALKTRADRQLREHRLAVERGDYVFAEDMRVEGAALGNAIRKVVLQIHLNAPSLAGLELPEIEAQLREIEDDVLRQFNTIDPGQFRCPHCDQVIDPAAERKALREGRPATPATPAAPTPTPTPTPEIETITDE